MSRPQRDEPTGEQGPTEEQVESDFTVPDDADLRPADDREETS